MPNDSYSGMYENTFKSIFDTYRNRLYSYVLAMTHSPYVARIR